jgi:hypothetical protein
MPTTREKLINGLNNTKAESVVLKMAQVIESIGLAKAEELCLVCIEVETELYKKKPNSVMMPSKRIRREGYGKFLRVPMLHALQQAAIPEELRTVVKQTIKQDTQAQFVFDPPNQATT